MKKFLQILLLLVVLTATIFPQTFDLVSTKIVQYNNNSNIEFYESSIIVESKNFNQMNDFLTQPETIYLKRSTGNYQDYSQWKLETPEENGGKITLNATLNLSVENAGEAYSTVALLFEIRNTSANSADLYFALNPYITVNSSNAEDYFQIELYKTNQNMTTFTEIYYNRYSALSTQRIRDRAVASVAAGSTVYLYYAITAKIVATGSGSKLINGAVSSAFDASQLLPADDLGFDNLAGNDKMKFQIFNWLGTGDSQIPMGNTGANAFQYLTWDAVYSAGFALDENIGNIDGSEGITLEIWGSDLFSFEQWAGDTGDDRIYLQGTAYVRQNGTTVLTVPNIRFDLSVSYPPPYGAGDPLTASGWGEIDAANSDPAWVSAFDPFNTGEVYFECESINNPFQNWYNALITVVPSPIERFFDAMNIPANGNVDFAQEVGMDMQINVAKGNDKDASNRVMAFLIKDDPGGTAPAEIEEIFANQYWEVGTTAQSFSADLTFDLSGFSNISNYDDLRILKRESENDDWIVWNDYAVNQAANEITALNLSGFSQFAVGSVSSTTPVELVSFSAQILESRVKLAWQTATEIDNYGFEIQRSAGGGNFNFEKIGFVQGHGNSNSPKRYSFSDDFPPAGKLLYRLKQIDTDGKFEYSDIVEVEINAPDKFRLEQNYPNPFSKSSFGNATTVITYEIPERGQVKITVFDILGNVIAELVNEEKSAGRYQISFNGSQFASGIYFYRLRSGKFVETKKMLLIR